MLDKLKKTDWSIVILMVLFMGISTIVVHSATANDPFFQGTDVRNVINYGIGFVVLFGAMLFDYRLLVKGSWYLYAIGILMLVAVYLFGVEKNSAKSWFILPFGFNFQPAELVKLLTIIAIAAFMNRRGGEPLRFWQEVVPIGLMVALPVGLIVIQPDLGNAIIFLVILIVLYWIGNIKYTHVLIGSALIAGFIALFFYLFQIYYDPVVQYLKENDKGEWVHRINRIHTFVDPDAASADAKYQVHNSMRAIGSGGLTGEGFLSGDSIQKGFIPLPYSDSIFVVIGEEFGFVGASVLLLLYFLLIYRMIYISIQSQNRTGAFIIIGIVSMYVFQVFENIGMMIGIMPLTGITLPFVSYGGSSVLINMMAIGIVLSIHVHQEQKSLY
ncbi:rod shape-determining protein RodA [Paenibacillus hemerocallicola]|uniref:Rod shape-determining protein RodA n=1 Tax=Paenibacillus hemerocallicola TaxID=1172614 RepID=A0A5C4TGX1_9BACL|nr:FtsW/RodA/SpoVE family cell cycle protein [Paenibacillus hemerocallicola]TNJ67669.1 rod shape-determining protein RodA [Paenibacillus hemerocallicola]